MEVGSRQEVCNYLPAEWIDLQNGWRSSVLNVPLSETPPSARRSPLRGGHSTCKRRCVGEREGRAEARGRPLVERPSVQILVVVASLFKRTSAFLP